MKSIKKGLRRFIETYTRYNKKLRKFRGPQAVKGETQGHNLKLALNVLELMMQSKN